MWIRHPPAAGAMFCVMVSVGVSACASILDVDALESRECTHCADGSDATAPDVGEAAADAPVADAPADSPGDAAFPCPGSAGPASVRVSPSDGERFCIDATEVTNADYAAFLAGGSKPALPDVCAGKASFVPSGGWPYASGADADPVVYVDWCDANAFCAYAGKHLCGKDSSSVDPDWIEACHGPRGWPYPYGPDYDPDACNDDSVGLRAAGASPRCIGGVAGIVDMSGNVAEWDSACSKEGGAPVCTARGGAYDSTSAGAVACDAAAMRARDEGYADVGFRCCG